jgi:hypothetical protein
MALVHEYLIQPGGSEKVVQELISFAPQAPLYVSLFSPDTMPPSWQGLPILDAVGLRELRLFGV